MLSVSHDDLTKMEIARRIINRDQCMKIARRMRDGIPLAHLRTIIRVARSYNHEAISIRKMVSRIERRKHARD